jgi:hypothetical protein
LPIEGPHLNCARRVTSLLDFASDSLARAWLPHGLFAPPCRRASSPFRDRAAAASATTPRLGQLHRTPLAPQDEIGKIRPGSRITGSGSETEPMLRLLRIAFNAVSKYYPSVEARLNAVLDRGPQYSESLQSLCGAPYEAPPSVIAIMRYLMGFCSCQGSLTIGTVSNSTLTYWPFCFSTLRM